MKRDGSVVTWGDDSFGGNSRDVQEQLAGGVQHIYSTWEAFAALKVGGSVVAWGNGGFGGNCSGVQDQLVDVQHIYSTNTAFAALKADGSVVAWGEGSSQAEALARNAANSD